MLQLTSRPYDAKMIRGVFAVIGVETPGEDEPVKEAYAAGRRGILKGGLQVHTEAVGESAQLLGVQVGPGPLLRPSLAKAWDLRLGLLTLARLGRALARDVEALMSQASWMLLLFRPCLSILAECYGWVRRWREEETPW